MYVCIYVLLQAFVDMLIFLSLVTKHLQVFTLVSCKLVKQTTQRAVIKTI